MSNRQHADAFRDAWNEAGIPGEPGRSASRTMAEIRDRVHSGEWSPEEGIRRLEVDIDFNKQDVAEIEAVLRDESLDSAERKDLTSKLGKLHADIAAQEKASTFMRRYFRKEPVVTAEEAKAALDPAQQSWLDNASPDEIREGARLQGLGEIKGDTAEEVWNNAVKAVVDREMASREAKKAAAAKKAAKKALPKAEPKLDPDNPERLDVRQIGTGIDFKAEDKRLLDGIQERLDAGESPAKIAESLDSTGAISPRAQRAIFMDLTDLDNRIHDAKQQKMSARYIKGLEEERVRVRESFARLEAQAKRQEELGRRLRAMPTPAKKTAPAKAAAPKASKELSPLANGTRRKSMTNVEVGDLVRGASGSQGELAVPKRVTSVERVNGRMVITREDGSKLTGGPQTAVWLGETSPEVTAAKKETAEVQARLLTTAMERLEAARTEAQVRDAVKGLLMPELKTVAGKYPLDNVGKSKESLTRALVQFHTNRANFEVLTRGGMRGNPIEPGRFSDKPKLPNTYETRTPSPVYYHDDGPVGTATERLGADAKLEVDGDSLENTIGRLATRSATGQISAEHMLDELKALRDRLPPGPGKNAVSNAVDAIDFPKGPAPTLPPGTPAPLRELAEMFSGMPLAHIKRPGHRDEPTLMEALQEIARRVVAGEQFRGGLDTEVEKQLYNKFHESYEAEGKFELDRAVRRAMQQLEELHRETRRRRLAAQG